MKTRIIAVSGGIGSGKSMICRMLETMGYQVYDCDSRSKKLVDNSPEIIELIGNNVCAEAINPDGTINRKILADAVFNDAGKLACLNRIVHGAVTDDLQRWCDTLEKTQEVLFFETAILYQSGLDKLADEVWEVEAPEDLRVRRACKRDNLHDTHVKARINAQKRELTDLHPNTHIIINDDVTPVIPQIELLLRSSL